ncbi:hypothetical protein AYI69_g9316 [Smittium culicis]|uniref:Uncharacterized protein n=1 Tax=Smittium culicis TaxID=133412 RepID=A0A1R1XDH1_9FUNG|nr:hypothetical protein AYI69_g9316 [Smittium culicis]
MTNETSNFSETQTSPEVLAKSAEPIVLKKKGPAESKNLPHMYVAGRPAEEFINIRFTLPHIFYYCYTPIKFRVKKKKKHIF